MLLKSWSVLLKLVMVGAMENLMYYDPGNTKCQILYVSKENLLSSLKGVGKTFCDILIYARQFLFFPAHLMGEPEGLV